MKRLLFIAPAIPNPSKSGLRMRGWLFLKSLSRDFRITLVAGSPAFPNESDADLEIIGELVDDAEILHFRAAADPALLARRLRSYWGRSGEHASWDWAELTPKMNRRLSRLRAKEFSLVHVFRLYMLSVAHAIVGDNPGMLIQLDLDDWESKTRRDISNAARDSLPGFASRIETEASALEVLESRWCPQMKRLFVCSREDAAGLTARYGLRNVLPVNNAVAIPASLRPAASNPVRELLFVGALGYYPNQNAICFLLEEVLPRLINSATMPFRILVAGAGAPGSLQKRLRKTPNVLWIDSPEQVEPLYERAVAALAPIKAGGGTRIKALEAFAQGRPLIATDAAMAGLDAEPGVHFLQANTAGEWASVLKSMLESPSQYSHIAESAFAWVHTQSLDSAMQKIAAACEESG